MTVLLKHLYVHLLSGHFLFSGLFPQIDVQREWDDCRVAARRSLLRLSERALILKLQLTVVIENFN